MPLYMTGGGAAATLGYPDYGLVTMSEMADNAGRMPGLKIPVIADADTGYGNELNAIRTVVSTKSAVSRGSISRTRGSRKVRPSRQQGSRVARRIVREDPRRRLGAGSIRIS